MIQIACLNAFEMLLFLVFFFFFCKRNFARYEFDSLCLIKKGLYSNRRQELTLIFIVVLTRRLSDSQHIPCVPGISTIVQ